MRESIARLIQALFRMVGLRTLDRQFLASYAVLAGIAVLGLIFTSFGLRGEPSTVNLAQRQLNLVETLTGDLLLMREGMGDVQRLKEADARYNRWQNSLLEGNAAREMSGVDDPAVRQVLERAGRRWSEFLERAQILQRSPEQADLTALAKTRKELRQSLQEAVSTLEASANEQLTTLRALGLTATALIVVLLVMGRFFGTTYLMQRIHQLRTHLMLVSDGDLAHPLPIASEERDNEIGQIFSAYNEMRQHRVDALQEIRNQAHAAGADSENLSMNADQITKNAEASSEGVDQVSHSVQEVNQVVQDVANNIAEVSQAASDSSQATHQGQQTVQEAAGRLNDLKSAMSRVEDLTATIQNIAKKTDLLALNAAIEAANAGEQGKGFAVVADEVRKLAEQTGEATRQVEEVVNELRTHSDSSVSAMGEVESRMGDVLNRIEDTDHRANQIASAAEELAATMGETADNVASISGNVTELASSVNLIQEASQKLGRLGFSLERTVRNYRLELSEPEPGQADDSVDFGQAKIDHFAWKTALRKLLNGERAMEEKEATSHKHCNLGQWIYGPGMAKYGDKQTMKQLESVHKSLHESVSEVIKAHNAGNAQQAQREYNQFEAHSNDVVTKLDRLREEVS